jgi:hypothetical protein
VTVPSTAARRAAFAARGSSLCVLALLVLALALSPEGTLLALAFLGFLLMPSLVGSVLLARAAQRIRHGAEPLAQLLAGALLLVPGGGFVVAMGTGPLRGLDLSQDVLVFGWASLVLGPAALVLGAAAPLLLWSRHRLDAVRVVGWANAVVLVVAVGSWLSWAEARVG